MGQLEEFVTGLLDPSKDAAAFQTLARDFLIQLKEFNSDQWTECSLSLQLEQQHKEAERVQVRRAGDGVVRAPAVSLATFDRRSSRALGLCRAAVNGERADWDLRRRRWRGCRCRV